MNKLVVPAVAGAATAAAGTVGVVKYKKKKHMENEMSKAIMSVLPQDLTEEERRTLTKSIMKGAFESTGLDKLAFVTCAGTLLFKDGFSSIVKEAEEEFKNDIKNEVIDAIASISEEILKEAGMDYGFTAYKDTDGNIEKDLKKIKILEETGNDFGADYIDTSNRLYNLSKRDWRIGNEINKPISNRHLANIQYNYIPDMFDDIITKADDFKFSTTDTYSGRPITPVTGPKGAEALNKYLQETVLPTLGGVTERTEDRVTSLKSRINDANKSKDDARFYQILKKIKAAKDIKTSKKALSKAELERDEAVFGEKNISNWSGVIDESLNRGNNIYQWEWY